MASAASAVPRADRIEIDAEIAHDALDDLGAQPVVIGQRITLERLPAGRRRWLAHSARMPTSFCT